MDLKIYYGTPKGVWVYMNGIKMTTEQATNELLTEGKLLIPEPDKDKNKPVGLFSPTDGFNIVSSKAQQAGEIPLLYGEREYVAPIDYQTITPEDLKNRLKSRINELRGRIKNIAIEIKCFRDSPPD